MALLFVTKTALTVFCSLLLVHGVLSKRKKTLQITVEHKPSVCTERANRGDTVSVHYTGILETGKVFDSSVGRQPIEFELGQGKVIKGWDEGIKGMCVGEKRKLVIPPNLGYGSKGVQDVIPPNAVLIFTTELVAVKKKSWFDLRSVIYIGVWPVLAGIVVYSMYRKIARAESGKPAKGTKKNKRR